MKHMQGCKVILTLVAMSLPTAAIAKVAAMDAAKGTPIEAETLISSHGSKLMLVDQKNIKIEMAPYSVAEFSNEGVFKLLRGSAMLETNEERTAATNSAQIDFSGTMVVTFDHKEKSTSAFVVEGEARLKNPHEPDFSLRLDRGRGASMILGDVYPSLVRDISPAQVDSWLKGYAWEAKDREHFVSAFSSGGGRGLAVVANSKKVEEESPVKLEDYFAAIDDDRPDLYERKFSKDVSADKIVETAQIERKIASEKTVAPEEAAMISMPTNKINLDLGLPEVFASSDEAFADVAAQLKRERRGSEKEPERKLAAVGEARVVSPTKKSKHKERGEAVSDTVARLMEIRNARKGAQAVRSGSSGYSPADGGRAPAAINSPIPDPVYDFSENF